MKKKLILPLLALGIIALPTVAKAAGPVYGASKPFFGGERTYGYTWAGWDGKYCSTTTVIGDGEWTDSRDTWAQTSNCSWSGDWNIYERHSFR